MKITPFEPTYNKALHYYAIFLCLSTWALLFIGGMVTSTDSGLSVPDWPTTYNYNMFTFPPSLMVGGIFYEHGHRLVASLVGLLTIGICLALWKWDSRRWLKQLAIVSLLLVLAQGVLGGVTVLYKLPMPVSVAHATVAEIFFLITGFMAFATSQAWINARPTSLGESASLAKFSLVFCALVLAQIVIGAVMRHSYAGLAIPTFPDAFGGIVPSFWNFGILMHYLHSRVGALVVGLMGCYLGFKVLAVKERHIFLKASAGLLLVLILVQCALGIVTIWSGKAPVLTSLHVAAGALLFMDSFLLFLAIYRLGKR